MGDSNSRGYSTQAGSNGATDGFTVTINYDSLSAGAQAAKQALETDGSTGDLSNGTLMHALTDMVQSIEWASIPNADVIQAELLSFVTEHGTAMQTMTAGTLQDFVLRLEAAADLALHADPATQRQAAFIRAHTR